MDNLLYENDKKVNVRVLRGEESAQVTCVVTHMKPTWTICHGKDGGKLLQEFRANSGINWSFTTQVKAKQWRCLETYFFWSDDLFAFLIARMRTQGKVLCRRQGSSIFKNQCVLDLLSSATEGPGTDVLPGKKIYSSGCLNNAPN